MKAASITVDDSDVMALLDTIDDAARNKLTRPVAQAGAQVLYEAVLARVPFETKPRMYKGKQVAIGLLKRSIYQAFSKDNSGESVSEYHISWNHKKAPHGFNVEFGHGGPRPAPAKAFLRRSYEERGEFAGDAMVTRLNTELDKLGI